ncbi:MAG: hypothetical protein C5B51_09920 [Terriglobia bacterium]|nr:MAG: hypothetical protein C5B51_09920 [Terriglobia bacterium]
MHRIHSRFRRLAALVGLLAGVGAAQTTIATGLDSPIRLTRTAAGNFFVSEAGQKPNTGHISLVDRAGSRRVLLNGLPSAIKEGSAVGPTGTLYRDRVLYVLIGEGDVLVNGSAPGTEVSNPAGPASPIFSSLLSVTFSADPETLTQGFTMTPGDHYKLADGLDLTLDNGAGATATISVVADFRDAVPDPFAIMRSSDPFGMDFDPKNPRAVYVADAAQNSLLRVDLDSGRTRTLAHFPPFPNGGTAPPVSDAVPTSVHAYGSHVLITFLSGFPFATAVGRVLDYDPATNTTAPFIYNLTTAMDIAFRDRPGLRGQFFTLEFSLNLTAAQPAPGRLQRYDSPVATVVSGALITPTCLALDPATGDLYVTELATGRILKFTN